VLTKPKYLRKIIHIGAEHSPNVALGLAQQAAGLEPTNEELLPGVISWQLYQHRLRTWDKQRIVVGLDGQFYEGAAQFMFSSDWMSESNKRAALLNIKARTKAKALGIDTAEGGDKTCWAVVDEDGLIELESFQTPNTDVICGRTIAKLKAYGIDPTMVLFDQGGGGKEHAQRLQGMGYPVNYISFAAAPTPEPVRHLVPFDEKVAARKERLTYKNKRVEMYYMLHLRMDPVRTEGEVFAIPSSETELMRQMAVFPITYDQEGVMVLPPKSKRDPKDTRTTITEMLGCSPDETDALVLAAYAMEEKSSAITVGAMF
jgi:hypothetical protein